MSPLSYKRIGRRTLVVAIAAISVVTIFAFQGFATHPGIPVGLSGSDFESEDGNLKVDNGAGHLDWANVSQTAGSDLASGQGDDSLKGAEQDPVPDVVSGGIPPSKSDLKNFGVFLESDSPGFMHMYWTRVQEPQGTTNMDFEFNQRRCVQGVDTSGCSSNGKTPNRQLGDILITYNLSSGGDDPSLWLHRWIAGGNGLCEDSQEGGTGASGGPCWDVGQNLTQSGDATGAINSTAIPGSETDGLATANGFSPFTFGEASVDLSAIFGQTCFALGGVYLKSRSSDTFTAALKDFIAPVAINVSNCGSVKVVKKDDAGNNLSGVKFKLYRDDGDGVAELGSQDVQIATTSGALECETTSNGTGNCEWSNLLFANYWLDETFLPAGYSPPAVDPQLVPVTSTALVTVNVTNARKHKIIVITCHEGTNSLVKSDVTIDGTKKTTIDTAPSGVTAADLCGLGGATFGGLGHGSKTATIDVGTVNGTPHS
jgi:hypothetical protein